MDIVEVIAREDVHNVRVFGCSRSAKIIAVKVLGHQSISSQTGAYLAPGARASNQSPATQSGTYQALAGNLLILQLEKSVEF